MTWEPGMIAVCDRTEPPRSEAEASRGFSIGSKYPVIAVCRGRLKSGTIGAGLFFIGKGGPWDSEYFHPLDDGDIQGLREKYGELVSGKKERAE
jgi:hypothetical protein